MNALGSYRDAIASIESAGSGDYSAIGPEVHGDRAYGRYQVMGANIPSWTRAALGRELTPEEFLASPEAQDVVFDHVFGGYAQKYGPEGAAKAWFSGEGGMNNPNASDGYTTNAEYAARFMGKAGDGNALRTGQDFNPNAEQMNALLALLDQQQAQEPSYPGMPQMGRSREIVPGMGADPAVLAMIRGYA